VALVGDSASGVRPKLDWQAWCSSTVDLNVPHRSPRASPWVLLDARTQLAGVFCATRATLYDIAANSCATAQTLVLAPRRR